MENFRIDLRQNSGQTTAVVARFLKLFFTSLFLVAVLLLGGGWIYFAQPTWQTNSTSLVHVEPERLKLHVETLVNQFTPRNFREEENLALTADYIAAELKSAGADVTFQKFFVGRRQFRNVIGRIPASSSGGRRVIVGAHYDSYAETPGADDNASGVAGLLELAHLITEHGLKIDAELVAYTLEEPPFFASDNMGSFHHAETSKDDGRISRRWLS